MKLIMVKRHIPRGMKTVERSTDEGKGPHAGKEDERLFCKHTLICPTFSE